MFLACTTKVAAAVGAEFSNICFQTKRKLLEPLLGIFKKYKNNILFCYQFLKKLTVSNMEIIVKFFGKCDVSIVDILFLYF